MAEWHGTQILMRNQYGKEQWIDAGVPVGNGGCGKLVVEVPVGLPGLNTKEQYALLVDGAEFDRFTTDDTPTETGYTLSISSGADSG